MLRRILSVGGFTLLSRVTGFARDIVLAAIIGAGPIADAFVVALRIPNHFRAIFGEGAFNNAFVPTYSRLLETTGPGSARTFSGRITTLMLLIQIVLLVLALPAMPFVVSLLAPGRGLRRAVLCSFATLLVASLGIWPFAHGSGEAVVLVLALGFSTPSPEAP